MYCFHTAGVLHISMLYNLLGPGISFYWKSKINVKRKPNYEIGWFHNWPIIISQTLCLSLYKRWFSVITINQMMFFIHLIHYKVYLKALKNSKLKWIVKENTVLMYSIAYNLWTFTWFVHFELPFRLKDSLNSPLIYSILFVWNILMFLNLFSHSFPSHVYCLTLAWICLAGSIQAVFRQYKVYCIVHILS